MDGKLLILCDEKPNNEKKYKVRDCTFLTKPMIDPNDDPERVFISWDSIIPEDRGFIEECKLYARTLETPPANFPLTQRGSMEPSLGTIKTSLQEQSFYETYNFLIERIKHTYQAKGFEEMRAEALELGVQYPFDATQVFLENFSKVMNSNGIVRILPAFKNESDPALVKYRKDLLDAWVNANAYLKENQSYAEVLSPMLYNEFGEVVIKSGDEMLKIYSLPIL